MPGKNIKIKILSKKKNPLLERIEIQFEYELEPKITLSRLEARNLIADALKKKEGLVFITRMKNKTGTLITVGAANIYEKIEQAELIEPNYILKRNKPKEVPEVDREWNWSVGAQWGSNTQSPWSETFRGRRSHSSYSESTLYRQTHRYPRP